MPTFLTALQAIGGNTAMQEVNYIGINENNKEFIRQDQWSVRFSVPPRAVYYPGEELFKARLRDFTGTPPAEINFITQRIRGFDIQQATNVNTSGTYTMNFTDREDQAITLMFDNWRQLMSDRDTRYSFRKEDTVCEVEQMIYNTSRFGLRKLVYRDSQPESFDIPEDVNSEDATGTLSEVSMTGRYQHYTRLFLNV